jgi:hypothetical protein
VEVVPAYGEVEEVVDSVLVLEEVYVPGEDDFYREGSILLERANQLFNSRDYSALRKLFIRADYTFNTDSQWNKLESGFKNWFQQAGKILTSEVYDRDYFWNYDNYALFRMNTNYEKAGVITEEMEVVYFEDRFYIRFLGTR